MMAPPSSHGDSTACAKKVSLRGMFRNARRKSSRDNNNNRSSSSSNSNGAMCCATTTKAVNSDGSTTDFSGSHTTGRRVRDKPQYDSDSDIDRPKGSVFFRCFGGGRQLCRASNQAPLVGSRHSNASSQQDAGRSNSFSQHQQQPRQRRLQQTDGAHRKSSFSDADQLEVQLVLEDEFLDDSFYSVQGDETINDALFFEEKVGAAVEQRPPAAAACLCGVSAHCVHDPEFPLVPSPQLPRRGGYEEMLSLARSLQGYWVTILERSESLDAQYRMIGLGTLKRSIMNRLAVPITMFLERGDTVLHNWLHTPLGIRHMCANLHGLESEDNDPDAGLWRGSAEVVDWLIPDFCSKPVRAIRQTRHSDRAKSVETRVVLPDAKEGKILLYNFAMEGKGPGGKNVSANRVLRWVSPPVLDK